MKPGVSSLLLTLAVTSVAFGQTPPPTPPAPPKAVPPVPAVAPVAPVAKSAGKVNLEYRGPLKDALRKIASQSGINLIATGDLERTSEVFLKDASGEEALDTVANAYNLKVTRKGSIWTLRPMTEDEIEAAGEEAEARAEAAEAAAEVEAPEPPESPEPAEAEEDEAHSAPGNGSEELLEQLREKGYPLHKSRDGDKVATGNLVVDEGERVETAVAYGGNLLVNGRVNGDAVAFGGNVALGPKSVVKGNVVTFGGNLHKDPGARVGGEEMVVGPGVISQALGTMARHSHSRSSGDADEPRASRHEGLSIPGLLMWFAVLFSAGFLFILFAPARMKQIESELRADPVKCALTGVVGALAFLPLVILLCITVIGIPVALALVLIAPLALAVGYAAVASEIGLKVPILRGRKSQAVVLALGLALILLVGLVPVLGVFSHAVVMLLSVGAVVRTRFGSKPKGFPEPIPANTVPVG